MKIFLKISFFRRIYQGRLNQALTKQDIDQLCNTGVLAKLANKLGS